MPPGEGDGGADAHRPRLPARAQRRPGRRPAARPGPADPGRAGPGRDRAGTRPRRRRAVPGGTGGARRRGDHDGAALPAAARARVLAGADATNGWAIPAANRRLRDRLPGPRRGRPVGLGANTPVEAVLSVRVHGRRRGDARRGHRLPP